MRPLGDVIRWSREPLLYFLAIGAALFGLHRLVRQRETGDAGRIVITSDFVEGLRQDAQKRNGHAPTVEELRGLVERFIDDEVLYREAIALGLDQSDVIVRRRLVEKMEFLTEDAAAQQEPSDAELAAWLGQHSEQYREPGRVSFQQVFVAQRLHPDMPAAAMELLTRLRAGAAPEALGDPFLAGRAWTLRTQSEIASIFGPAFAEELLKLPAEAKAWHGPIQSSFGLHLVSVSAQAAARDLTLDEVRPRVRQAWLEQRRHEADRGALARARSHVQVDLPPELQRPVAVAR